MKRILKIAVIMLCFVVGTCVSLLNVEAASFGLSGPTSVDEGGTITVSISASGGEGAFKISASGGTVVGDSTIWSGGTTTIKATSTTSVKITATCVTFAKDDEEATAVDLGSKSITVDVKSSDSSSSGGSSSGSSSSGSSSSGSSSSGSSSSGSSSSSSSSSNSSTSNDTTTEPEETKSTNNNLATLTVSGGTLSPEFSASTTSYTVEVTDLETITIEATKADSTASISGIGEKELEPGINEFNVVVTAESGSAKTYSITITLLETPTAFAMYGDVELGAVKDISEVQAPDGFEETTVTLGGEEVTAWSSNLLGMTLVYMIDGDGVADFYLYDTETGLLSEYRPLGLLGHNVYIVEISEEDQIKEGMIYQLVTVDGNEIMGWAFEDEALSDYLVIYVMNDTGEMVSYLYCITDNAMIKAPELAPVSSATYAELVASLAEDDEAVVAMSLEQDELNASLADAKYTTFGLGILATVLALTVVVLIICLFLATKKAKDSEDDILYEDYSIDQEFEEATEDDMLESEDAVDFDDNLEEEIESETESDEVVEPELEPQEVSEPEVDATVDESIGKRTEGYEIFDVE